MKTGVIALLSATVMVAACDGGSQKNTESVALKKIITAQIFIKPEKIAAFLDLSEDLIEKSRSEPGCISYSLYQDPRDSTKFLFLEEWENQAAIDFHFATEHFQKFGGILDECASAPAVITVYDSTYEKKV